MKRVVILLALLLLSSLHTVYAEEIYRAEVSRLPKTHNYSDIQLFSEDTFESRITDAWENHLYEVDVSDFKILKSEFADKYEDVFYHNPIFYYVSNTYSFSSIGGYVTKLYPEYDETDPDIIAETLAEIRKEAALMLMEIDVDMTDFEKVMAIHDYMVMNYEYDTDLSIYNVTVMTEKKGVCMAYSLAFNYMMELLGIESVYVCSEVMDHSWNLVKIDGEWYHIDVTWDDPTYDKFAQVKHDFAFLSTDSITGLSDEHIGFDTGDIIADSTLYDDAPWRDKTVHSAIVYSNGMSYWVENKNLVREDGKVIFENLDGGDNKWHISERSFISDRCFAGLAAHENKLYFNSDKALYSYDVISETLTKIKDEIGICGLFIEEDELEYCKRDSSSGRFVEAGEIHISDTRIAVRLDKNNKLVVSTINETDNPIMLYCFDDETCQAHTIKNEIECTTFDTSNTQDIFLWDNGMKPLRPKRTITLSE